MATERNSTSDLVAQEKQIPVEVRELDEWHLPPEPPKGALGKAGSEFYAMYAAMQKDLAKYERSWLTQGDYAGLISHCKAIDDFTETCRVYDKERKRMRKEKVYDLNKHQNALHKAIKLVQSTAKELGLTPEKAIRIRQTVVLQDYRRNPVGNEIISI